MAIKNSILLLTKIAPVFPVNFTDGVKLDKAISDLLLVEKREDLTILAQGYKAVLAKRKNSWLGQPPKVNQASSDLEE